MTHQRVMIESGGGCESELAALEVCVEFSCSCLPCHSVVLPTTVMRGIHRGFNVFSLHSFEQFEFFLWVLAENVALDRLAGQTRSAPKGASRVDPSLSRGRILNIVIIIK
jgi:hypothetical protein